MHDSTVGLIAYDSVKTDVTIQILLGTKRSKLLIDADFCHITLLYGRDKPAEELHHCYSVTLHGVVETSDFCLALLRLHHGDRRNWRIDDVCLHCLIERIAGSGAAHQNAVVVIFLQCLGHGIVRKHVDTIVMEIYAHLGREFSLVDEESGIILADKQEADKDRIAVYVRATEIERPGDVIESCHQHAVGMISLDFLADAGKLRAYALASKLFRLYFHLI